MSAIADRADAQGSTLALRVLNGDLGLAQLWFDARVLDRYVGLAGWRVMRTNTVGRVRAPDGTSFDFGIAEGDAVLHATATDLTQRLPASERQHWAQHLLALP